jgi:formylglycine-generating enzyme required for sulfatase activity
MAYDLFLSYHWRDRAAVEAIAKALRDQDLTVFLDRWYLVPGQPWPRALEQALLSCRAAAVFLGSQGMGSWQQREKDLALDRQARDESFSVIPVILPGAEPGLEFLSLNTWVDLRDGVTNPEALLILARAARGEAPDGPGGADHSLAVRAAVCPFRGLSFFREEDAPFFFGREDFSERLAQEVTRHSLVAVVGASGCGKSSVVRAGLLPLLRQSPAGTVWEFATMVPGDRPFLYLAATLLQLLDSQDVDEVTRLQRVDELSDYLAKKPEALRNVVERLLENQAGTNRLLLVVDQWEELYTLAEPETAKRFSDTLLAATVTSPLTVVLTLRGDFYGHTLAHRPLADRLQGVVVNLGPMTRDELHRAVVEPAARVGLTYEAHLDDRIISDVGDEPGNLPLLEFVLKGLWEARRGGQLHHAAYQEMGGVAGAMAQRAEAVWETVRALDAHGEERLCRVFLDLVHSEEGAKDTRRRIALDQLDEASREIAARLARERLLVAGRDEARGGETLEVAHEALIRHWRRLREWLDADREFRLWQNRLAVSLGAWEYSARQDEGTLLRGGPLAEAERWQQDRGQDLTDSERAFIQAGVESRQQEIAARQREAENRIREAEDKRRQVRTKRILGVIAVVLVCVAAWFAQYWWTDHLKRTPILPEMVDITPNPKGFPMGAADDDPMADKIEKPRHQVVLTQPYAIGTHEVTFDEYDRFVYDTGRRVPDDSSWKRGKQPVINVSWEDAVAYCVWLSKKTGKHYRLPTEAEWEYAARSGGKDERWVGTSSEDELVDYAWYDKNSGRKSHLVGQKKPNGQGLYDMSGNVWEWCHDWYEKYSTDAVTDPVGPRDGSDRVFRGGCWINSARGCRSACRSRDAPGFRLDYLGFRLARGQQVR